MPSPTEKLEVDGVVKATSFQGDGSALSGVVTSESDPSVNALGKASLSCGTQQVAKWSGFNWICADDNDSDIWSSSGSDVYYGSGNVGIGTTEPSGKLDVFGDSIIRLGQLDADGRLKMEWDPGDFASFTSWSYEFLLIFPV